MSAPTPPNLDHLAHALTTLLAAWWRQQGGPDRRIEVSPDPGQEPLGSGDDSPPNGSIS
jgi:hypothetical protein